MRTSLKSAEIISKLKLSKKLKFRLMILDFVCFQLNEIKFAQFFQIQMGQITHFSLWPIYHLQLRRINLYVSKMKKLFFYK